MIEEVFLSIREMGKELKQRRNGEEIDYEYMTAPCGIPCFECKVNVEKPSLKTFLLSNGGKFLLFKKFNLKWNDSICRGCRAEEGRCKAVGFKEPCKVYACTHEKGIDFCYECDDFPCDHLHPYKNKALLLPHNTKVFNLCLIKKMGVQEWAKTKAKDVSEQYYKGKLHL